MRRTSSKTILGYKVFIRKRGWKSYFGVYVFKPVKNTKKIRKKAKLQFFSENLYIKRLEKLLYYTEIQPIVPVVVE